MTMDSALAISSTSLGQSPAKGGGAPTAGPEVFAEVIAGIAAVPDEQTNGIGTGINLRFNIAVAEVAAEDMTKEGIKPAKLAVPDLTPVNTVPESDGTVPGLDPVEGKPSVRRKRDADEASLEGAAATPTGSPVTVPIHVAPAVAEQQPTAVPLAAKARGPSLARQRTVAGDATPEKGPPAAVSSIVSILADQAGSAGERSLSKQSGTTSADSRNAPQPVPASLTAVADIVQNLPPLIQSQFGAAAPATSAAIGPATDVGATLSGEVIDMGIGGQWIDRVAREITALAQGSGHSRFQLNPPNLGRLQIDVWQGEGGGRVQLLTETDEAAMRLRQDQASLQADARLSALSLDRIVIDRAPGAFGASQDHSAQTGAGRHQSAGGDSANGSASQSGQQTAAQHGNNGGSAAGQGKAPQRRDVFNDHTQPDGQDGRPSGRADDRHVRYA